MQEIKVLIADDHTIFRQSLKNLLKTNTLFEVVADAEDGLEAIKLTEELKPDVVLMDLDMPGMNGLEAARGILAAHPDVKIVMLTMYGSEHLVALAMEAGVSGYVTKDTDAESLFQYIVSAYRGDIVLDPSVTAKLIEEYRTSKDKGLTKKEKEVLTLLIEGKTRREIAELLHISIRTVDSYRYKIFKKLGIKTVLGLAKYALQRGYIFYKS